MTEPWRWPTKQTGLQDITEQQEDSPTSRWANSVKLPLVFLHQSLPDYAILSFELIKLDFDFNLVAWANMYILIGRAKRAPHWGVQSRFRVIYIYIYVSVVVQNAHAELRGQTRACSRSVWGG